MNEVPMPVAVICSCEAKLKVADRLRGQYIKCPECGTLHEVEGGKGGAPAPTPGDPEEILDASGFSDEEIRAIEKKLDDDEKLLWAGKPELSSAAFFGWAFASGFFFLALVLMGIGLFMLVGQSGMKIAAILLLLVGVVAIGVGCALPFYNKARYRRMAYAVTDKRALLWSPDWFLKIKFAEYDSAALARFYRQEVNPKTDLGNLIFSATTTQVKDGPEIVSYQGFFYVKRSSEVERLIREVLVDPYTDRIYDE